MGAGKVKSLNQISEEIGDKQSFNLIAKVDYSYSNWRKYEAGKDGIMISHSTISNLLKENSGKDVLVEISLVNQSLKDAYHIITTETHPEVYKR